MRLLDSILHSDNKVRCWVGRYVEIDLIAIFVSAIYFIYFLSALVTCLRVL